jgi:Uma2 family endonuclease
MTTQEYFATPETVLPQQLAYGVWQAADAPSAWHQELVAQLFLVLHGHVRSRGLGKMWLAPLDVILDYDRALVVQPDLLFISDERSVIVTDRVHGAPDLAIEVLSPWPRIGDMEERLGWFAEYGVRECWLVHQFERSVEVVQFGDHARRRRFEASTRISSAVLPQFALSLDDILRS